MSNVEYYDIDYAAERAVRLLVKPNLKINI